MLQKKICIKHICILKVVIFLILQEELVIHIPMVIELSKSLVDM